ncbi:MAG: alginate export family protein [Phocaeicola sp.]
MKRLIIGCLLWLMVSTLSFAQTNNPASIYEGNIVQQIEFNFQNLPLDSTLAESYKRVVASEFAIPSQSQYSGVMASYYVSKLNLLPFVEQSMLTILPTAENGVKLTVQVVLRRKEEATTSQNVFNNKKMLPVLYNSERAYLSMRVAASEMVYSNHNTWFGNPTSMTNGNPLADSPTGKGWSAWLEGFTSAGLYGVFNVVPKLNLHLYGGASYLVSFSAGDELFTNKSRIYADIEDAFVGVVGGEKLANGNSYRYNLTYGRKSFTLGDGWLITNTSMNGHNRAALQLNPRWAAKPSWSGSFTWNRMMIQGFSLKPNELPILNSRTTINGVNLEISNKKNSTIAFSYLTVPNSNFRYYLPDGTTYSRSGMEVYNLRFFKTTGQEGGLFVKSEVGYQRNRNFDMNAWAYYGEVGWKFAKIKGAPTLSYRYAHFDGDDPNSSSYNRWDALYTGGNGEQWVQGSAMYKVVQNSNERTHRIQAVYSPYRKMQMVGQFWLFYADEYNNIGGNPALSVLSDSKFYGTEYNLTLKYFHSRQWYFHFNAAYALPGGAIKNMVPDTRDWFCATLFGRYSF